MIGLTEMEIQEMLSSRLHFLYPLEYKDMQKNDAIREAITEIIIENNKRIEEQLSVILKDKVNAMFEERRC